MLFRTNRLLSNLLTRNHINSILAEITEKFLMKGDFDFI